MPHGGQFSSSHHGVLITIDQMAAAWCAAEGFCTGRLHQDDASIDVPDEQIKKLGKEPKQVQDGEW